MSVFEGVLSIDYDGSLDSCLMRQPELNSLRSSACHACRPIVPNIWLPNKSGRAWNAPFLARNLRAARAFQARPGPVPCMIEDVDYQHNTSRHKSYPDRWFHHLWQVVLQLTELPTAHWKLAPTDQSNQCLGPNNIKQFQDEYYYDMHFDG